MTGNFEHARLGRVEKAYAGFRAGNLEDFLDPFDDDSIIIEAASLPYGGTYRGRDAIRAALMQIGEVWTNLSYDIEEIIAGRNYVIAYGDLHITARSTGRALSFKLAEVWRFEGERLISLQPLYFDTAEAISAL